MRFFFFGRGEILHILALSVVHVHPDQSHIWGVVCPFCARNKVLLMLNKGRTWTSCRYADKHLLSWKCADVCGGSSPTGWWNYCHRFRKPAAARQASSEHKVHFFDSFPKAWPGRDKTIRKVSVSSPCNCRFLSAGPETPQPPSPSSVCSYPLLTSPPSPIPKPSLCIRRSQQGRRGVKQPFNLNLVGLRSRDKTASSQECPDQETDRKQPSQHFDIIFYVAPRKSLTWLDGTFNWHGEMIHLPLCMLKSLELIEHVNINFWKGWKSFQRKRKSYMFCVFEVISCTRGLRSCRIPQTSADSKWKEAARKKLIRLYMLFYVKHYV